MTWTNLARATVGVGFVSMAVLVTAACNPFEEDDYTSCPAGHTRDGDRWCENNVEKNCYETSVDWNRHVEVHTGRDCDDYEGSICRDGTCEYDMDCEPGTYFCLDEILIHCTDDARAQLEYDCKEVGGHCVGTDDAGPFGYEDGCK
jgi:hypothetical protein